MLGLRTAMYYVDDMEKAKEWYSKAFETEPYWDTPYYMGFDIGGYELGLHPINKPIKRGENQLTYWGVEDIESTYKRLLDIGATVHEAPNNVGGNIVVGSVYDPFGNVIGLIYNPDFKLADGTKG